MLNRERGATALLVASSLLLLVGFAAVAIDLSAGFNERRQGQTAADLGVLAGAIEFVNVDTEDTLYQILNITRENLRAEYGNTALPDDTQWIALWRGCTDTRPPGFNPWPLSASMQGNGWTGFTGNAMQCISASTDEIRVKLPDQLVGTTFGGVLGANEISTSALAHAKVKFTIDGGARPFAVLAGASTGSLCLTTRSGSFPPCDGPDSGNFGTLNSQQWGNDELGTTTDCGLPGNDELAVNVALGTDHLIGLVEPWYVTPPSFDAGDSFPADLVRLDDCEVLADGTVTSSDDTPAVGPTTALRADTGFNQFQATKAGLVSDAGWTWQNVVSAPEPLLQQVSGSGVFSTRPLREKISGTTYENPLDNTPLWEHLRSNGALPPGLVPVCGKTAITGAPDRIAAMNLCLTTWETAKALDPDLPHLFEDTIWESPRFMFVPQFHSTTWGSGNHWQPILGFRVVYLDTMWFNCNGNFNNTKNA
ncbi:MAG TPA: Tad domain-containing protein, partial [Acidimicrobiia bacterium]|nr:Tad domain-containing protein [Acidimicrobiia bacterium]